MTRQPIHAGTVARFHAGCWRGALILGESGAGKSDLALRALAAGWRLVADDYSLVWTSGGRLWARAPDAIRDRMEVRGLGVVPQAALALAPLCLAVRCEAAHPERMPEPEFLRLVGTDLPLVRLRPFEASAVARLDRALVTRGLGQAMLGTGPASAYLARSPEWTSM